MLPNTFIIGAQKAGTTFLYSLLLQHHEVAGGSLKEPGFFTERQARGLDWYLSLFEDVQGSRVCIDASTQNSLVTIYDRIPERIVELNAEARFIFLLRNPYDRIESSWMQYRGQGVPMARGFNESVRDYELLVAGSRYWTTLSEYLATVDRDRFQVILFRDLVTSPSDVRNRVLDFLGLDGMGAEGLDGTRRNQSYGKPEPAALLRGLHRLPGYKSVRRIVPEVIREHLGQRLKTPIERRPSWSLASLEYVRAEIGDEAARILRFLGEDPSSWDGPSSTEVGMP